MTKKEAAGIRAQLERLGLSQRAAAVELGMTERTMQRYCSGEVSVPRTIFMALHLIELALRDETQRKWLSDHGVKLAYVAADGSDVDITESESGRLAARALKHRGQAKKIAKPNR